MNVKKYETNTNKVDIKYNAQKDKSNENKKYNQNEKRFIKILNIAINSVMSIFLLFLTYCVVNNYEPKFEIFFYLTLWSFFMNEFYILSITVLDLIKLIKYEVFMNYCYKFNDFIRNSFLRICFPFSISIVFLYWMLILLGDEFQYASRSLWDNCISFCFHGLIFVFLLYDTLSYPHINKRDRKVIDFIIITSITIVYFLILGISKYVLYYNVYDFMYMSNVRQIAAAGTLIYMGILDGYIIFVLIANRFFIQETKEKSFEGNKMDEKTPLKDINLDKDEQKEKNMNENNQKKNNLIHILEYPKNTGRIKLKPINSNNKRKNDDN